MSTDSLKILSEFFILISTNKSTITNQNILSLYQFINNKLLKIITRFPSLLKGQFSNNLILNELFENHKSNMNNFINGFLKYLNNNSIIERNSIENNRIKNNILIRQKSKNKNPLQKQNNENNIIYIDLLLNNKINPFEINSSTFINFFNQPGNEKFLTVIDLFMKTSKYLMQNKLVYKKVKILYSKDDFNIINKSNSIYKKRHGASINYSKKSYLTPPKLKKYFFNKNFLKKSVRTETKEENNIYSSRNDSLEDISDIETMRIQVPHNIDFSRKEKIKKPEIDIEKYLINKNKKNPTAQKIKKSNITKNKFMKLNSEEYSEFLDESKKCKTFENIGKHYCNYCGANNVIKIGKNIKKDYKGSSNIYDFCRNKKNYKIKKGFNFNSSLDENIVESKENEQCNIY